MAKIERLSEVGIFTRNQKLSKEFYTRKLGMTVRVRHPKSGYLSLGVTKGGRDAGLDLWQPVPEWGETMYRAGLEEVGSVTGIGFRTSNLDKTVEQLAGRGVKVEKSSDTFGRLWDPDGNVLFLAQERRPKVRRTGLRGIDFITVVVSDVDRAGGFYRSLGMKPKRVPGEEGADEDFTVYRLAPDGTAIMPFTPTREMYDNPADYDEDMAHLGEVTSIAFKVDDVYGVQKKLLAKGVRFSQDAEEQSWGGVSAKVLDPDGNEYMLYEWG